jgi:hypothetical protein
LRLAETWRRTRAAAWVYSFAPRTTPAKRWSCQNRRIVKARDRTLLIGCGSNLRRAQETTLMPRIARSCVVRKPVVPWRGSCAG